MKLIKKMMIGIEFVLVVSILILFMSAKPKAVYPTDGMIIRDNFNFVYENGKVVISEYPDFREFVELKEGSFVDLLPGRYYWKVVGLFGESEVRNFSVESKITLEIKR